MNAIYYNLCMKPFNNIVEKIVLFWKYNKHFGEEIQSDASSHS